MFKGVCNCGRKLPPGREGCCDVCMGREERRCVNCHRVGLASQVGDDGLCDNCRKKFVEGSEAQNVRGIRILKVYCGKCEAKWEFKINTKFVIGSYLCPTCFLEAEVTIEYTEVPDEDGELVAMVEEGDGMNFSQAVEVMKMGNKVRRMIWAKDFHLCVSENDGERIRIHCSVGGKVERWKPHLYELEADDWWIVTD